MKAQLFLRTSEKDYLLGIETLAGKKMNKNFPKKTWKNSMSTPLDITLNLSVLDMKKRFVHVVGGL
jgi:hypothetical protein